MKIKSYYAGAVEDAIAQARQELGEDAMLVKTRRSPAEAQHLGEYEVVFAAETEDGESAVPAAPRAGASEPAERFALEIGELKRELEGMRRALARSAFAPSPLMGASADAAGAYAALIAGDVNPELARELVEAAERQARGTGASAGRSPGALDPAAFERALAAEIESRIAVQPELGRTGAAPRIVALVGPPGAGKTTTLVKLAVTYGLACRRPALLLSMDTYRIAAAEQLQSYATILGIGCQVLETVTALAQTIEENRGKELIFIDTPGLSRGDLDATAGIAQFLGTRSDIDTQLVLPASMKAADLARAVDDYETFSPRKLLFTKLDETGSFGPVLSEAARTGKALSFFTTGQRIPEDLEAATRSRAVELVLAGGDARRRTAA